MEDAFVQSLSNDAKLWLAKAIAGIIVADGVVEESELEYLRQAITFLEDINDINGLVSLVKKREKPDLPLLQADRKTAARLLMFLATIAVSDDKLARSEANFFKYAGGRLGFDASFSQEVLNWARNFITINKERKKLIKLAESMQPVYKS